MGSRLNNFKAISPRYCFLVALFLAVLPSAVQAQTEKIIFSIPSRSIAAIDLYIAREKGFFREEGLDVDLVQIRGNVAIAAAMSGQVHATNGVGTVIRALERSDLPLKILTVSLKRNLFWLVSRSHIKTIAALKNKTLGTTTLGGAQHTAAARLLRKGGLDPDKDVTVIIGGDVPAQLQSLVAGTLDAAALSPPSVILARDKYGMNVLGSAMEDVASLQNGTAVSEKFLRERRDVIRQILRARAKAGRYFWENERATAEVLAKYQGVDYAIALESYRISKPAFTNQGIPSEKEVDDFLKADAELLKLPKPVPASKIFDFSMQREVNQELGIK